MKILTTLYNGHAHIWSYETQSIIKTFELTDVPVRAGRFIERKNWIVCGSDDFQLRVVNWNTSEKVKSFEAYVLPGCAGEFNEVADNTRTDIQTTSEQFWCILCLVSS